MRDPARACRYPHAVGESAADVSFVGDPARQAWAAALVAAVPLAVAFPLVSVYLIAAPPAADLAAATYRSELFARVGFTTWDTGWYAAHGYWLPSYSLLSPALGALLGVRVLLALSALAACALFGLIAERVFDRVAGRVAGAVFALGFCVGLLSGRVPYDLGFTIGLGAVLALLCARPATALTLAVLTSVASPVAGAFLALAGLAIALTGLAAHAHEQTQSRHGAHRSRREAHQSRYGAYRSRHETHHSRYGTYPREGHDSPGWADARRGLALSAAALIPILVLGIVYPDGGYEPFAAAAFWPALAGVALIALLLPQGPLTPHGRRVLRVGAALYALALIGAYAIHTPVGGNAARLGPLLAAPLLAGVLWEKRRLVLLGLAVPLLYWQLATPIHDYSSIAHDPSVNASYYAPLRSELRRLRHGKPTIVEVPLTAAHWESAYLAGHDGVSLARGWERQLDTRYAAIFYRKTLTPSAYRAWLAENRVMYVALPDVRLDKAGSQEGALVARGLPYLRELWRSQHWRLYRFIG